ncbi:hypothetical protein, partial [Metabacillus niabensis]|uniref:hypothetical protein n=1 Tax=Metabacillus niabensis TaxID=324854 RepID=UPI001CFA6D3C
WKDETIRGASDHFRWIHSFEKQIQEAEKRIENINWLNPLKLKENRLTKDRAEEEISRAKTEIKFHDEKLNYHREKLGFSNEKEFNQVKTQHEDERPGLLEKNKQTRQYIRSERDVLQKAENAHKNAFVRQMASYYPERPEMRYMSFQTALKVVEIQKKYGKGKVVPIENIEKTLRHRKQEIKRLNGELTRVDHNQSRLQRAESYLENYERHQAIVEKYENNPLLKGKMLVSKSAKQEYERAMMARNSYQNHLKNEGISGRTEFESQKEILKGIEAKVPEWKEQIHFQEKGLGLFDAVMRGIEVAAQEMHRQQKFHEYESQKRRRIYQQNQAEIDR